MVRCLAPQRCSTHASHAREVDGTRLRPLKLQVSSFTSAPRPPNDSPKTYLTDEAAEYCLNASPFWVGVPLVKSQVCSLVTEEA